MNYKEKYTGSKEEFYIFLKEEVINLFKDKLRIEGNFVSIPDNEELDFQIKIDSTENYGDFSIKVIWGEKPKQNEELEETTNTNSNSEEYEF